MSSLTSSIFQEIAATRYMSAVGLTVLSYDHLLTFSDEVELIWSAPTTYAKYIFLLNRYIVLGTMLAVAYESCGFIGDPFTDMHFMFTCAMIAITSIGIANLLILQRVVILWEHRPIVLKIMTVGFLLSFVAQVASMVTSLISLLPAISWSSVAMMCVSTTSSRVLVAVWACPMLFEVFVLGSTALNALDRPRTIQLPIIKALHSDGLGFFLCITFFRLLNLILAAIGRPSLTFLAVFFVWAMTTTVLGRLLLHLRRAECSPPPSLDPASPSYDPILARVHDGDAETEARSSGGWDQRRSRAISPFGLVPLNRYVSDGSTHSRSSSSGRALSPENPLEITQVPMAYRYHYQKRTYDPDIRPWD